MAKAKTPTEEKFEKQDFDLFEALAAIDKKDYGYFDRLTVEQQKKFVPFMLIQWASAIKGNRELQEYYLRSIDYHANKHMLDYMIASNEHKHPKLQWLMLCAASPGLGKQFHQWIPNISTQVSRLKSPAKEKDIKEYYKKVYPKADEDSLKQISELFVINHKKKMYLAEKFPAMKIEDIETLVDMVTDKDIEDYERDYGN
jgi:hypothetical protein